MIRLIDDGSECNFLDNRSGAAICAFEYTASLVQAIFRRRRHQPRRPPPAKIRPGRPAPAMGPGTGAVMLKVAWNVAGALKNSGTDNVSTSPTRVSLTAPGKVLDTKLTEAPLNAVSVNVKTAANWP